MKRKLKFESMEPRTLMAVDSLSWDSGEKLALSTTTTAQPAPQQFARATTTSIQSRINAAAVGSTVTIAAGTYYETVTVNKAITLKGVGVIIDGQNTRTYGLVISAAGATVEGFEVKNHKTPNQDGAVRVLANATVRNIYSHHNTGAGISVRNVTGGLIENCDFSYNRQLGYHVTASSKVTFRNNAIHHNNLASVWPTGRYNTLWAVDPFWEAGGGKGAQLKDVLFENNRVYANGGNGLWGDVGNLRTTYRGNRVYDNDLSGIHEEISSYGVIEGNYVYRNGLKDPRGWWWPTGILVSSSGHTIVRNNVLAWNPVGIAIISQSRGDKPSDYAQGISVTGNFIAGGTSAKLLGWAEDWSGRLYTSGNSGSANKYWGGTQYGFEWGRSLKTLSTFNATAGEEGGVYVTTTDKNSRLTAAGIPTS